MATVGYSLKCGTCSTNNNVSSNGPVVIMWVCTNGHTNISSLPANTDGTQKINPLDSVAIIPQALLAVLTNVIKGLGL